MADEASTPGGPHDAGARDAGMLTGRVELTDPRAITALAHPARVAAIDLLYSGHSATATQLAAVAGITPSAMSYHLRALQKWGVVVRAEALPDARERPWRAAARSLTWSPGLTGSAEQRAGGVLLGQYVAMVQDAVAAWSADPESAGSAWDEAFVIDRGYAWLTAQELAQMQDEITAVTQRYRADRDGEHHPEGTRRFMALAVWVPSDDPLDTT